MHDKLSTEKKIGFSKVKFDHLMTEQDRVFKTNFQANTWYEKNDKKC